MENEVIIQKPFYDKLLKSMDTKVIEASRFHKNSWRYDWSKFPKEEKPFLKKYLADYELGEICGRAFNNKNREALAGYTLVLKTALEFLGKPISKVKVEEIKNFASQVNLGKISKGEEKRYQLKRLLSSYIKWRLKNNVKSIILTKSLDANVERKEKDVVTISEEEVDQIYKKCANAEERYLIAVLFSSGARIQEFMNIRFSDIAFPKEKENFCKMTIRNETSKTKGRTIPLFYKNVFEAIQEFVEERKKGFVKRKRGFVVEGEDDLVWITGYASSWNMLQRIEKRANLTTPLHFHLFRHSCANWLRERLSDSQMDNFFGWRYGSGMKARYGGRNAMEFKDVTEKVTNTELGEIKIKLEKQNYDLKMRMEQMELKFQTALEWVNKKPSKRSMKIIKKGEVIETEKKIISIDEKAGTFTVDEVPIIADENYIETYEDLSEHFKSKNI